MADWRQVQARIRKAKASKDAPAQLAALFERTRDAMVAYELGAIHEKTGDNAEAIRWYTTAAERFRRPQWRAKTEEALTRLGAPIPAAASPAAADRTPAPEAAQPESAQHTQQGEEAPRPLPFSAVEVVETQRVSHLEGNQTNLEGHPSEQIAPPTTQQQPAAANGSAVRGRRRRGRRGGRRHRGKGRQAGAAAGTPMPSGFSGMTELPRLAPASPAGALAAAPQAAPEPVELREREPVRESLHHSPPASLAPAWQGHARTGEPALASRIAQLESQLRRLLACPSASLDEADKAPAGPGVLVLSDSDHQTHYYIEACQTLRIAIGNLLRGGRGSKEGGRLKEALAENLGVAEARVSKYLKDHCIVRWLQLDEGAPQLAHFAVAVLRPVVNE